MFPVISTEQALTLGRLMKNTIITFCNEHGFDYVVYLQHTRKTDMESLRELEKMIAEYKEFENELMEYELLNLEQKINIKEINRND